MDKRREAFEAWHHKDRQETWDHVINEFGGSQTPMPEKFMLGTYDNFFAIWNAALDSVVIELPDKPGSYTEAGWAACEAIDECREAIESAGLKVKP